MRYRFPTPPSHVAEHIRRTHRMAKGEAHFALHALSPAPQHVALKAGKALQPHRAYTLSTRALQQRNPLAFARPIGWRSLDVSESGKITTRLVGWHPVKGQPALLEVHAGNFGSETIKALSRIEAHPNGREFEFRYLVLPQVFTKAIWLHGSAQDAVIPLPPAGVGLAPGKIYGAAEFFAAAARLIKWRLADRTVGRANG